jgi:uncharacterized SAM-binding protein YcdF (DUF218 family)
VVKARPLASAFGLPLALPWHFSFLLSVFCVSAFVMRLRPLTSVLRPLALVLLCLLLLGVPLAAWLFPQQVLTVDSGPVKADVLLVLGGGLSERPRRAAELFKAGEAPRIILSGKGDHQSHKRLLIAAGVPERAIEVEGKSTNTKENAEFTVAMLRAERQAPSAEREAGGAKRVIIVTSWYHSRRALNCFRHYAPEIEFYSRPSYSGYSRAEWKPQGMGNRVKSEYVKLLGYWVRYGVCPL